MTEPQTEAGLVVTPEALAAAAGVATLTTVQRAAVVEAIRDAQDDVVAYLGVPITPTVRVAHGCYPYVNGWSLPDGDLLIDVVSVTPETYPEDSTQVTGLFTVTYRTGLDAANDPELRPIVRYVRAHALNSPEFTRLWKTATGAQGEIRNVSAEGQSISFTAATLGGGGGKAGSGEPGALPSLASLDRWRVADRRVHQAPTRFGARELW